MSAVHIGTFLFGGVDINHCSSKARRKKAQGLLSYPVTAWPTWQKEKKSAAMSYTNIQMCKKSNSGVQRLGLNATVGGGNGVCFGVKCPSAALSAARSCICNLMFLWRKLPTCKVARKQRWQKKKKKLGILWRCDVGLYILLDMSSQLFVCVTAGEPDLNRWTFLGQLSSPFFTLTQGH